jgi:hypothetical protein
MGRIKLPFVNSFRNRHGTLVFYFRKRGCKNVRLRGVLGSAEFMAAYTAAIEGQEPIEIGMKRSPVGSVAATVGLYLGSTAFANLATETQRTRRNILERFREEHGDKRIAAIERKHVQAMVTAKGKTPSAARNFLNTLRAMIAFAIDAGIRADDPTIGVKRPKIKNRRVSHVERGRHCRVRSHTPARHHAAPRAGAAALHWAAPLRHRGHGPPDSSALK